jgi:hypothetical protein
MRNCSSRAIIHLVIAKMIEKMIAEQLAADKNEVCLRFRRKVIISRRLEAREPLSLVHN